MPSLPHCAWCIVLLSGWGGEGARTGVRANTPFSTTSRVFTCQPATTRVRRRTSHVQNRLPLRALYGAAAAAAAAAPENDSAAAAAAAAASAAGAAGKSVRAAVDNWCIGNAGKIC